VGNAAVDQHGAALLAMGILGAFVRRLQTGEGTRVEGSLLNAGLDLQTEPLTMYYSGGGTRDRFRRDPHLATWYHEAPYGVYRMADRFVAFSLGGLGRLGEALGSAAIAALEGRDAAAERDELAVVIAREVAGLRIADVAGSLDAAGVWYAIVQDFDEVRDDPQVVHNRALFEVPVGEGPATLVNHPIRYDGRGAEVRVLATRIGEHSREVLRELGYGERDIERHVAEKVIVAPGEGEGT
jgi:crotonobetainyl-CoA:carnitine CoA-transferase CaiB-like acyl-CoA transferase